MENLIRSIQNHYKENFKTFLKDTKVDLTKWKVIFCPWMENSMQLNIMKMSVLPKLWI